MVDRERKKKLAKFALRIEDPRGPKLTGVGNHLSDMRKCRDITTKLRARNSFFARVMAKNKGKPHVAMSGRDMALRTVLLLAEASDSTSFHLGVAC